MSQQKNVQVGGFAAAFVPELQLFCGGNPVHESRLAASDRVVVRKAVQQLEPWSACNTSKSPSNCKRGETLSANLDSHRTWRRLIVGEIHVQAQRQRGVRDVDRLRSMKSHNVNEPSRRVTRSAKQRCRHTFAVGFTSHTSPYSRLYEIGAIFSATCLTMPFRIGTFFKMHSPLRHICSNAAKSPSSVSMNASYATCDA
jgi:hypothetical protein